MKRGLDLTYLGEDPDNAAVQWLAVAFPQALKLIAVAFDGEGGAVFNETSIAYSDIDAALARDQRGVLLSVLGFNAATLDYGMLLLTQDGGNR